jgi:hypothetical protein
MDMHVLMVTECAESEGVHKRFYGTNFADTTRSTPI